MPTQHRPRLLPPSVVLALSLDRLDERRLGLLQGDDEPHTLGSDPLPLALRVLGATEVWAVLPAPSDPQGLTPPAAAPAAAAGEAVLLALGPGASDAASAPGAPDAPAASGTPGTPGRPTAVLVPERTAFGSAWEPGAMVRWRRYSGAVAPTGRPSIGPGEARLALVSALHAAIEELTRLDVVRERPELREELIDLSGPAPDPDAEVLGTLPDRAAALLLQALRSLRIVELAARDEGGATTARQVEARSAALRALARHARDAVAVATYRRLV